MTKLYSVDQEYLICRECKKHYESLKALHVHIRAHGMNQAEYYQTHYPRRDLYDKSFIKYKNRDYYFNSEFNSKSNLKKWLATKNDDEILIYCRSALLKRSREKKLKYSLSQVETRSLNFPPINYFLSKNLDYYKLCSEAGLQPRLNSFEQFTYGYGKNNLENVIKVDSREQRPLKFKNFTIEVEKLDFGDYTLSNQEVCGNIYIERKSLNDFIGTMSKGYDRFKNELCRSQKAESYMVVVIEAPFKYALNYDKIPLFSKIKATPDFIFHRLRSLMQEYDNLQFLFVNSREESSRIIEKILTCKGVCRNVDLQLFYDLGRL